MDIGVAENDEQRESTYRFLNDEMNEQHALLMDEARSTDTKATVVAGFAAASVSFLLQQRRATLWWAALMAGLMAMALAVAALWPRRWAGLSPFFLEGRLAEAAPVVVVGRVADAKAARYARNSARVRAKAVLWMASVACLAVGTVLSVASTIAEVER